MPRPPFDPSNIEPFSPAPERPGRRERRRYEHVAEAEHLTVGELAGLIKRTLEEHVASPLRVIGQVSNLSARNHWYFSLKDESAVVSCVAWASSVRRFGFTPKDGDEVIATGHVSHYAPQGRTQFYVTGLEPVGAGALQLRFQAMCAELRELGYFDADRKKPLPVFPRRVAIVTSAEGAALHDVRSTAQQRCPAVGLVLVGVRVQGEGAGEDVARVVRWVDEHRDRLRVDAMLVTRGGGSIEDLWAFNERVVADAVFGCTLPVVAAIGHESDTTVVELVADRRAATPTQAVMTLVPAAGELRRQLDHLGQRLTLLTRRRVERGRERLQAASRHEAFRDPGAIVRRERRRLDDLLRVLHQTTRGRVALDRIRLEQATARLAAARPERLLADRRERLAVLAHRLERAVAARVDRRGVLNECRRALERAIGQRVATAAVRLRGLERELAAVDPRRVLRRGFTYTLDERGALVRSVLDVHPGDALRTMVADGAIDSVVGGSRPRGRPSGRRRQDGDQMDLFHAGE